MEFIDAEHAESIVRTAYSDTIHPEALSEIISLFYQVFDAGCSFGMNMQKEMDDNQPWTVVHVDDYKSS